MCSSSSMFVSSWQRSILIWEPLAACGPGLLPIRELSGGIHDSFSNSWSAGITPAKAGASDSGFCGEWKCAVLHVANSLW